MGEKPFIKFYPSDFLAGTSGLSPAERGVYITLLCLIYENDGPIKNDTARLSRRCGVPAGTFKRTLTALIEVDKVSEVDGMLTNRRAERSITDRSDRVNSAKVAAQSRWSKETGKSEQNQGAFDAPAMRSDMRSQCASDAIPEPEPELSTNVERPARKRAVGRREVKRASKLPDGWVPDLEKARRVMDEYELTREEMNFCYKKMEAHAHANGRTQKDWDAAYRNWVISEIGYGTIGPNSKRRKQSSGQSSIWD